MFRTVTLSTEQGLATLRLQREHGNAINPQLVEDLLTALRRLEADDEARGVLLAASGKLFSPGLDLQELSELDRPMMERFLHRFNECILSLYTFSKPMVAAMHGHAIAGGCVLSLTADWRILRDNALVGLNEVKVGVPFPFGVAMILRESVSSTHLEEVALFGHNYRGAEALAAGLVHEVRPEEGFEEHCIERLEELAGKDPQAFALTKRYLRQATVERIRANDPRLAAEFLDRWFSPETRERVGAIVAQLRERKA